jgi:putative phosphoesterase
MTIAFISDVHGNFEALRAVFAELDRLAVRRIVCLGDVVGYYPQVNEVCDALRARDVFSLMGNHDWYMVGGYCSRSRSAQAACPVHARIDDVHVVHGGWNDPIDEYMAPSSEYFAPLPGRRFASGHTHVPTVKTYGDKAYCNPGSVGMPRDGDPRASFALYNGGSFEIHRVEYDPRPVFRLMEAAGFDDYFYGGLVTGAPRLTRLPH